MSAKATDAINSFLQHLERSADIVRSWPDWKRSVLALHLSNNEALVDLRTGGCVLHGRSPVCNTQASGLSQTAEG
jgi:hypothetical protein